MIFNDTTVAGTVEILASKDFQAIPVTVVPADDATSTVVKAGSPLDSNGQPTDGDGGDVVGILLYDVDTAVNPNGAAVVAGIIDGTKAQANSGITYDSDLYTALPAITFRTNIGVNE